MLKRNNIYFDLNNNLVIIKGKKVKLKNLNREDLWNEIFPILNKRIKF